MMAYWDSKGIARAVLIAAVVALSVWMLWRLLQAFAWAGVLAIATWPLRQLLTRWMGKTAIAALLTFFFAVVLVVPLIGLGVEAAQAARTVDMKWMSDELGLLHDWLSQLPYVGPKVSAWWADLSKPGALSHLLGEAASRLDPNKVLNVTGTLGAAVAGRLTTLVITLITLFCLYRDGPRVMDDAQAIATRMFGPIGGEHGKNAIAAVRAAVNGLVLVGLVEGLLLGIAYYNVGFEQHAALLGLVTAVLSMLPLGAPLAIIACALELFHKSETAHAIELLVFGAIVVVVADHVVRPMLIGKRTHLPFLGVLLGIIGGLETFNLIGLFLGPAIIAVLVAIWREGAHPDAHRPT
jgi:predicted PurR-regulated permease PerM